MAISASWGARLLHIGGGVWEPQVPTRRQAIQYWSAFVGTMAPLLLLVFFAMYTPQQDHLGSISLNEDGTWYQNYEPNFEIQDQEIFFHGIGHSIENARQADIVFLGASNVAFGIDWRLFEEFERTHHVKMFNMSFAGIGSGAFSLRIVEKWNLRPKLWIIHADMYQGKIENSFFFMKLPASGGFGAGSPGHVVKISWLRAYLTVAGRNIRWRLKRTFGLFPVHDPYRSAKTGNWYLDHWPGQLADNATIKSWISGTCPENPDEVGLARRYMEAIQGSVVLIQVPSVIACSPRIQHLASALAVPAFTVAPELFSSGDGGGHLDRAGARKYTTMLFAWLEQLPEFRRLFRENATSLR
jgi:hypothetical protein